MIDFNVIDTLLYNWVYTYSGITTIWQNEDGPKPNLPYITLRRQSVLSVGQDYVSDLNSSTELAKISGDRDLVINIQAYGSNAFGRLEDLYYLRHLPASQELLFAGNLSLIDRLAIENITGLNDLEYEERATMDLLFRFASQKTAISLGVIETVNIEENVKNPDKTENFETDLT